MRHRKLLVLVITSLIVLLLAVIGVLAWKYQQVTKKDSNKETTARIIGEVGDLFILPSGEEPTVALIQDKNKLGNQEFFAKAKNGDYLLIYQKAKVALIYREKDDKLVNVGPVNIGDQKDSNSQTQSGQTAGAQSESQSE